MSLITRGEKGEKLTIEEMDGNLLYLEELAQTANSGATEVAYDLTVAVPYKAYRAKLTAVGIEWPGYGFLYNWFAVDDARGIVRTDGGSGLESPNLWRVPSDSDWDELITFAGGASEAGGKLKSAVNSNGLSFYGWLNGSGGNDLYNFGALPGGSRSSSYFNIGYHCLFWNSTTSIEQPNSAFTYFLSGSTSAFNLLNNKSTGCSVRLVREATASELFLNDGDNASEYKGNDDTQYSTVKIGSQIWLAQNLRETEYVNGDPIFNASSLFGGDITDTTWNAKGANGSGAWTTYQSTFAEVPYLPSTPELIYSDVLENTLGQSVIWETIYDGYNTVYRAQLDSERAWYPTHIKVTPGYDIGKYDENQEIIQRTLIIKRAVTDENYIIFFPIKVSSNGVTTIESFSNYTGSSNDSGVNIEILEYQPIGSGSSGVGGLGISLLD